MSRRDNIINNYIEYHLPNENLKTVDIQNVPKPENPDNENANKYFKNAIIGIILSAPIITGLGLSIIFSSFGNNRDDNINSIARMLGIPIAIGGFIIDTIKFPFTITWSIGALMTSIFYRFKSLLTESTQIKQQIEQQIEEITLSFIHRFANTIQLLVVLHLETAETITDKFDNYKNGKDPSGLISLCVLTILNTAYASRRLSNSSILLANGKILYRIHCPKKYIDIFDSVLNVRNSIYVN